MQIIHADIVYSKDREHLALHPDSYIAVEGGRGRDSKTCNDQG